VRSTRPPVWAWQVIHVSPSRFLGHGDCASDSWFVHLSRALVGNLNGAFHPTEKGAEVTAKILLNQSCPIVASTAECSRFGLLYAP
jgi:hypothetical protein